MRSRFFFFLGFLRGLDFLRGLFLRLGLGLFGRGFRLGNFFCYNRFFLLRSGLFSRRSGNGLLFRHGCRRGWFGWCLDFGLNRCRLGLHGCGLFGDWRRNDFFLDRCGLGFGLRCGGFLLLYGCGCEAGRGDDGLACGLEFIFLVILLAAGVLLDDFLHLDVHLGGLLHGLEVFAEFLFQSRKELVGDFCIGIHVHACALLVEKVYESAQTDVELLGKFVKSDFCHILTPVK